MLSRLTLVCLLLLTPSVPAGAQNDLRELARRAQDSVVLLKVYDASRREASRGTGFFVAPSLVVSNHHVVEDAYRVEAVLPSGESIEVAGVVTHDGFNDLTLLRLGDGRTGPPLPLAASNTLEVGEPIGVIGSPAGLAGTLSAGNVSALRPDGLVEHVPPGEPTPPVFQISAPISSGSSGSPVLNLRGEVVGVAVSQLIFGQNLNFAVPLAPLRDLLARGEDEELETAYGTLFRSSRLAYLRNLGISAVFFGVLFYLLRGRRRPGRGGASWPPAGR